MAIQRRQRKDGPVYRVLWRDERRALRSRTFSRKRDAEAWEAKVKLAKRQGELAALDAGQQTLKAFIDEWWRLYAEPNLAPKTLDLYARFRDRLIVPKLGHLQLRRLTPERIQSFRLELEKEGVGRETIRKTLAMLQGVLERGVEWGRIASNPARFVRKPPQGRTRTISPLSPVAVERLRREMLRREWKRDAALVSVLAYAGLRPSEALALRWRDIGLKTIRVDKSLSLGTEGDTKTRRARNVQLLAPLAEDLKEWRRAAGKPPENSLVFPTREGAPWADHDFRNWRKRRYTVAANAVGVSGRPYDLRHSMASLLLAEQRNPVEVAAQMGHTLQTLFNTYSHVIEDLRGRRPIKPEREIRAAKAKVAREHVAQKLPKAAATSRSASTRTAKAAA
jgi:integrase